MATFNNFKHQDFVALMEQDNCESTIAEEHRRIITEKIEGTFEASENNPRLNRFTHNVCFDHSRVVLPTERDQANYINANYVGGVSSDKDYICAEAPKQNTCYNFYRMLWMEHVQVIVMLCKKTEDGREKCAPYWSETENASMSFGKFEVTTTQVERFPHYVKTTLLLTNGTDARQVITHFNFLSWPDHGVPSDIQEFVNFVQEVKRCREDMYIKLLLDGHTFSHPPPIVVHCNAGLGRTPCFLVVDISIDKFNGTQTVSIGSIVSNIRKKRFHCLFNGSQYLFCYKAVKVFLDSSPVKTNTRISPVEKAATFFKNLVK